MSNIVISVNFVNENENENGENEKIMNLLTNNETKTKLKRENRKRLKTKTKKLKMKMPKQQNLSLNESASIQYEAYGCYGRTALNPWLTVDGIWADHNMFTKITNTVKLERN